MIPQVPDPDAQHALQQQLLISISGLVSQDSFTDMFTGSGLKGAFMLNF